MSDEPKRKRGAAVVEVLKDPRAYVFLAAGLVGFGITAGITLARNHAASSNHEEPSEHAASGEHNDPHGHGEHGEHGEHDTPSHASDHGDPHAHGATSPSGHASAAPESQHESGHAPPAHEDRSNAHADSQGASSDAGAIDSSVTSASDPVVHVVGGAAYQELPDGGRVAKSISEALDAIQGLKPKASASPAAARSPASTVTPAAHPTAPAQH
jgi:hypothetical protein